MSIICRLASLSLVFNVFTVVGQPEIKMTYIDEFGTDTHRSVNGGYKLVTCAGDRLATLMGSKVSLLRFSQKDGSSRVLKDHVCTEDPCSIVFSVPNHYSDIGTQLTCKDPRGLSPNISENVMECKKTEEGWRNCGKSPSDPKIAFCYVKYDSKSKVNENSLCAKENVELCDGYYNEYNTIYNVKRYPLVTRQEVCEGKELPEQLAECHSIECSHSPADNPSISFAGKNLAYMESFLLHGCSADIFVKCPTIQNGNFDLECIGYYPGDGTKTENIWPRQACQPKAKLRISIPVRVAKQKQKLKIVCFFRPINRGLTTYLKLAVVAIPFQSKLAVLRKPTGNDKVSLECSVKNLPDEFEYKLFWAKKATDKNRTESAKFVIGRKEWREYKCFATITTRVWNPHKVISNVLEQACSADGEETTYTEASGDGGDGGGNGGGAGIVKVFASHLICTTLIALFGQFYGSYGKT